MALTKISGGVINTSTSITAVGATFSGNVSVAGTLTYEDVTNIDSVGLITARSGIEFGTRPGLGASISDIGNAVFAGVVTATSYYGDGSNLTGIDATQIVTGDTSVQTTDTGSDGTIKFNTDGSEGARIDSSGRLLIGTTSTLSTTLLQVEGKSNSGTAHGGIFLRRGSAPGTNDALGYVLFGDNGSNAPIEIGGFRDGGTWTAGSSMPTRIVFSTTADGASSVTERLRISADGNVMIGDGAASEKLEVEGNAILDATDATLKIKAGTTGTTGALQFTFNSDSTIYGGLDLDYDNRATDGVRLFSGAYPITIEFDEGDYFRVQDTSTEYLRVDSAGRLLIGTSSARSDLVRPHINIEGAGNTGMTIIRNENSASGGQLEFGKSRGTAVNSSTSVSSGDELGMIRFRGADGTDMATEAARISCLVDGTPGSNDMPGRLAFYTTADGASSPTERMRITSAGYVSIGGAVTSPTNPLIVNRYGSGSFSPTSSTDLVTKAGLIVNPDSNNSSAQFSVAKNSSGHTLLQASNGSGSSVYDLQLNPYGNIQFNSGYGSAAVAYGCRAWVNFNGTGTVSIREDGNVSSITDNGTGDYTVNFTNSMPDANYSVVGSASVDSGGYKRIWTIKENQLNTGSVRGQTGHSYVSNLENQDCEIVTVTVFR